MLLGDVYAHPEEVKAGLRCEFTLAWMAQYAKVCEELEHGIRHGSLGTGVR